MIVFVIVILTQSLDYKAQAQTIHNSLTYALFTDDTDTLTGEGLVSTWPTRQADEAMPPTVIFSPQVKQSLTFPGMSTEAGIMNWFTTNILRAIWTSNDCGNSVCDDPEEYPSVRKHEEAHNPEHACEHVRTYLLYLLGYSIESLDPLPKGNHW